MPNAAVHLYTTVQAQENIRSKQDANFRAKHLRCPLSQRLHKAKYATRKHFFAKSDSFEGTNFDRELNLLQAKPRTLFLAKSLKNCKKVDHLVRVNFQKQQSLVVDNSGFEASNIDQLKKESALRS